MIRRLSGAIVVLSLILGCAGRPPPSPAPPSTGPAEPSFRFRGQAGNQKLTDRDGAYIDVDLGTSTCTWVAGPEPDAQRFVRRCTEEGRDGKIIRVFVEAGTDGRSHSKTVSMIWFRDLDEAEQQRRLNDDVSYEGEMLAEHLAELRASCMVAEPWGTFCTCEPCPREPE